MINKMLKHLFLVKFAFLEIALYNDFTFLGGIKMAERISDIRNRLDYLQGVNDRCNKLRLPLSVISLIGISCTAVSGCLFTTPFAGETLAAVTAGCATASAVSIGAYAMVSKLLRSTEDEIYDIEFEHSEDLEKEEFMERISGYTR